MPTINEKDIEILKDIGGYAGLTGVLGIMVRAVYKLLNRFTSSADKASAYNQAEIRLLERLQLQIDALQKSEQEMEKKIDELREELAVVRQENERIKTQNEFYKMKIDEQIELITSLETMLNSVHITDKKNDNQQ